ncbi:MAG: hypothetical protein ACXVP5_11330 [Tumebacillaceae bacterium]|jgi:hypothetical protein
MITLSGWMLYTMWAVLGVIGLDFLAGLYRSMMSNSLSLSNLTDFLGSMMTYVLPMMIVAALTALDGTGWLVMVFYYIGGLGIVLKYLVGIKDKLS